MGASVSDLNTPAKDALTMLSKHTKVPPERLLALSAAELHELALKIDGLDVVALTERAEAMGIPEADVEKAMEGSHATGAVLELMVQKVREQMEVERNAGLMGELDSMSVLALGKKARGLPGITKDAVNEAVNAVDAKAALIELIVNASATELEGAVPAPEPSPGGRGAAIETLEGLIASDERLKPELVLKYTREDLEAVMAKKDIDDVARVSIAAEHAQVRPLAAPLLFVGASHRCWYVCSSKRRRCSESAKRGKRS